MAAAVEFRMLNFEFRMGVLTAFAAIGVVSAGGEVKTGQNGRFENRMERGWRRLLRELPRGTFLPSFSSILPRFLPGGSGVLILFFARGHRADRALECAPADEIHRHLQVPALQ